MFSCSTWDTHLTLYWKVCVGNQIRNSTKLRVVFTTKQEKQCDHKIHCSNKNGHSFVKCAEFSSEASWGLSCVWITAGSQTRANQTAEKTESDDTYKLPLLGRLSSFWNTQTQKLHQVKVSLVCISHTLTGRQGALLHAAAAQLTCLMATII